MSQVNATRATSLYITPVKTDDSGSGALCPSLTHQVLYLRVMRELKTKWSEDLLWPNRILDPSSKISKATFRFSISLTIEPIHRVLQFFSSSFLSWETEVDSSTPCLCLTLIILLLTPDMKRHRQRRVQDTHYLKVDSLWIHLATTKLVVFRGRACSRRLSGINSSSPLLHGIIRDQPEVAWRRIFCPFLMRRHLSALLNTFLSFI